MKKRSFVLLELMIAIAICSSSIIPIIRLSSRPIRKEIDLLFEMELQRMAKIILIETEIALHTGVIPSTSCFEKTPTQLNNSLLITLPTGLKRKYTSQVTLKCKKKKIDDKQNCTAQVELKIQFFTPPKKRAQLNQTHLLTAHQSGGPS